MKHCRLLSGDLPLARFGIGVWLRGRFERRLFLVFFIFWAIEEFFDLDVLSLLVESLADGAVIGPLWQLEEYGVVDGGLLDLIDLGSMSATGSRTSGLTGQLTSSKYSWVSPSSVFSSR